MSSESNDEEDVSDNDELELSLEDSDNTDACNVGMFTETINLKGSSYHSSFQSHLRQCKGGTDENENSDCSFTL